jgi:Xaa-Pro aminopeptidase
MSGRYFPIDEYEQRWHRCDEALRACGLETAVVWSRSAGTYDRCADLLYLANYYGNQPGQGRRGPAGFAALILRLGEPPELFADIHDPRPTIIATERVHACADTFVAVGDVVRAFGSCKVGLVGTDVIPMKYWTGLQAATPQAQWVVVDELVRQIRLIKSSRELEAFRSAGDTVSHALSALMSALVAGQSEAEAAGHAAEIVTRGGGHVHMLAVNHGAGLKYLTSDPLVGFNHERPRRGDLARAWLTGPMFQGYWLGPGRTVVCGSRATPDQQELLEANVSAVNAVIAAIRPGITVRQLVDIGDRYVAQFGGELSELSKQWPLYGHGNGLFFEAPTISTRVGNDAEFRLEVNMVVSIEMFFKRDGVGEAGFENSVIVTHSGSELLTRTPMLW